MPGGYVPGFGNGQAKLMVCGEAPGADEEWEGKPFVGTTGRMIAEAVDEGGREYGIAWSDTYRTNVFKYHPPGNNLKMASMTGHTIEEGIPQLWDEVGAIAPYAICAVGDLAMYTLTGKTGVRKYRGSILRAKDGKTKVIPTIHPASLFKRDEGGEKKGATPWQMWHVIKGDIAKAVKQSTFLEYKIPQRTHHICRSPVQLLNFLAQHRHQKLAFIDIESLHGIVCCVGIAFDPYSSMTVPLYNAGSWRGSPQALPYSYYVEFFRILHKLFADPTMKFGGQNFKYDDDKVRVQCGFKIAPNQFHSDTSLKAHVIQPEYPVNLGFLTSIYTDEPFYKDEGAEFDSRRDKIEKFFEYNGKDCCVTAEISEKEDKDLEDLGLTEFYYGFVNKLHGFYMRMERRGFRIDETVRVELLEKYVTKYEEICGELEALAGHKVNVNSTDQVKSFLFLNMKLPTRLKVDDDTLSLLYANHAKTPDQKRAISLVLGGRRARKTVNTYLVAPPDFDGRMRCSWRIGGTETGRSSTSKLKVKRPLLHDRVGKKWKKYEIGMMFHNMTKHGEVGGDLRRMYIADEGCMIGEIDMSQAEARIVALLAGDEELLALFNTTDIHRLTASWLFGIPIEKVNKIAREIGKRVRHAGNYGMGKHRLTEILAADSEKHGLDITMSEWKAGKVLETFHKFTPKIKGVYHVEVERLLRETGVLVNAYGRRRQFCGRWEDALVREGYANIPQGTVPDHLRQAAMRVEERIPEFKENGLIGFLNEAHDALVWQSRVEDFERHAAILKEEVEQPIDFSKCSIPRGKLIIPAEVKWGPNYKDLKNYEFKVAA